MSKAMFNRVILLMPQVLVELLPHEQKKELDSEFERIARMDCDEASKVLDDATFRAMIEEAVRNIKRRRAAKTQEKQEVVAAYA